MNQEELKKIWKAGDAVPIIDFAGLQELANGWHVKLRKKVRIDIFMQSITAGLTLIPVFFYPKLIFASLSVIGIGIWYVRELNGLSTPENSEAGRIAVKQSLDLKISTMKKFFRRTRIVMYALTPWIFPAALYGLGYFDRISITFAEWAVWFIKTLVIYEIVTIIATEIYFKIIYTPALYELKSLRSQFELDE